MVPIESYHTCFKLPHWLLIHIRSDFKVILVTFKILNRLHTCLTLYPTSCITLLEYRILICPQRLNEVSWLQGLFLSCPSSVAQPPS